MKNKKTIAAFFDFNNTLYNGVVAIDFIFYLVRSGNLRELHLRDILTGPKLLYYYTLDKLNFGERYSINRKIYKNVRGWDSRWVESISGKFFERSGSGKLFNDTIKILNLHKKENHKVIIVTSALKEIINPVKKWTGVDDIIATEINSKNGIYTGKIKKLPVGKNRATLIRKYCNHNNINIVKSFAYSDHHSDIPLLESVGNPVAVNPDRMLIARAVERGWKIMYSN